MCTGRKRERILWGWAGTGEINVKAWFSLTLSIDPLTGPGISDIPIATIIPVSYFYTLISIKKEPGSLQKWLVSELGKGKVQHVRKASCVRKKKEVLQERRGHEKE